MSGELSSLLETLPQGDPRTAAIAHFLTEAVTTVGDRDPQDPGVGERLTHAAERLPPGSVRDAAIGSIDAAAALLGMSAGGSPLSDRDLDELAASADVPGIPADVRALRLAAAGAAALEGWQGTDPDRAGQAVALLRRALQAAGDLDGPSRVQNLLGLALGLSRRSELTNATGDLREARDLLREAVDLAGGPGHPAWTAVTGLLTDVLRLLGEDPGTTLPVVDGLRAHLWQVLVQPDLAGATAAARDAADDAVEAARRCLAAEDPAGALGALDAGRGLALFAATEVGGIAERLEEAGENDLAQRWRKAVDARDPALLAADLRRAAMTALTAGGGAAVGLLQPPGTAEIREALARLDADLLAYLVPGSGITPGYIVIQPAVGGPGFLAVPEMRVDSVAEIGRYRAALNRRDGHALREMVAAGTAPEDATTSDGDLAGALEALCAWAWRTAMRPLIESYLPRLPRPANGRPHHVVLVPIGELSRIPWQAARSPAGRYALDHFAVSHTPSARMLCLSAGRDPVPASPSGLLVGDPPGAADPLTGQVPEALDAAALEAFAVRQAFYPGARYVGRRPDGSVSPSGPGSANQVRDWLVATGPAAGSLLHLACHGVVRSGGKEPAAYLLLADRTALDAEELISWMTREEDRRIGLVVLAACRTGLALTGFDEAYSLGTAFLAGGARSVLSTHWSIRDDATSALMFMFHRFLRVDRYPPWAALREAQLWMLDRDRVVPDDMPRPLRDRLRPEKLADVVSWAGFVHAGH